MRLFTRFSDLKRAKIRRAVVTLGTFDGMHRGHLRVIRETVRRARSRRGRAVVFTFARHPLKTIAPKKAPPLITSVDQKLEWLKKLGVDDVMVLPFRKREAQVTAENFIRRQVCGSLEAEEFCLGPDTTFGRGGKGNAAWLKKWGWRLGFAVRRVPAVYVGRRRASSTAVRKAVRRGDLRLAARILGHPFCVRGRVVRGSRLGRKIGFPTANIRPESELFPPGGVYAARIVFNGKLRPAVLNYGLRPTIASRNRKKKVLEVHLLEFGENLYGKEVSIHFICKIRNERKFNNLMYLSLQIKKDVATARKILQKSA